MRVLSAASVRSLRIPYLFLAGLSEKVFPPPDREDRLYSEAEYLRLIDAGLPLVARTERTRDEMLLFYEAITRADEAPVPELSRPGRVGATAVAQSVLERGRTGLRWRRGRSDWRAPSGPHRQTGPVPVPEFRIDGPICGRSRWTTSR